MTIRTWVANKISYDGDPRVGMRERERILSLLVTTSLAQD